MKKELFRPHKYLTNGGLETFLIYNRKIDLPHFAAFPLIETSEGREILRFYYEPYMNLAVLQNFGFVLDSPTYKANGTVAYKLGYTKSDIDRLNQGSIEFLKNLKKLHVSHQNHLLISGCLGPKGDGYKFESSIEMERYRKFHSNQIRSFKISGADLVTAHTINNVFEAAGIILSARDLDIPIVMGLTLELDGCLINGPKLLDAISQIDDLTDSYCTHYMINCAHPTHFFHVLNEDHPNMYKIGVIRANASTKRAIKNWMIRTNWIMAIYMGYVWIIRHCVIYCPS